MSKRVFVQVFGFSGPERHALNRLFLLSEDRLTKYSLWLEGEAQPADVVIVDGDSDEAHDRFDQLSSAFTQDMRIFWVGSDVMVPARTAASFRRPISWPMVVGKLDELFAAADAVDMDFDLETGSTSSQLKQLHFRALLVDPSLENRNYLRAKCSMHGITQVDDATEPGTALRLMAEHAHQMVVFNAQFGQDLSPMLEAAVTYDVGTRVLLTGGVPTAQEKEFATAQGYTHCLGQPFHPMEWAELLHKL